MRVLEGGKTYEYEGQASSTDLLDFLRDRAYTASKGVVDLTKKQVSKTAEKIRDAPRTYYEYFNYHLTKLFSLRKDGYLRKVVEWIFLSLGFSTLSLTTKLVGFFLLIVAPTVLLLMMLLFPYAYPE